MCIMHDRIDEILTVVELLVNAASAAQDIPANEITVDIVGGYRKTRES